MPATMFKMCARELGTNFIDRSSKQIVVNMTWIQTIAAKFLQKFLDEDTVIKQVFSNKPEADQLKKFIYPSQLEITYGGTASNVSRYWPPTMPPMVELSEKVDVPNITVIPKAEYNAFIQ